MSGSDFYKYISKFLTSFTRVDTSTTKAIKSCKNKTKCITMVPAPVYKSKIS